MSTLNTKKNSIENSDVNYWKIVDSSNYWSSTFLNELGYNKDELKINLDYFLDSILHKDSKIEFNKNYSRLIKHNIPFEQKVSLLHQKGGYIEFKCIANVDSTQQTKQIVFKKKRLKLHKKVKDNNFYYLETATMTSTGSWYIDFEKKKSYWDNITRKILEYPKNFIPTLKMGYKLYAEEHQTLASNAFFECSMSGKPFDLEILMVTAKNRRFWARAMGKPVYNETKEIIGLRGIFQDIDDTKQKELHLEKTSKIIANQNSRLFNFAHIVSHNLRSHSSNLSLIIQLIDSIEDPTEKLDLLKNIKDVSNSLNTTIEHLNEVVTINTKAVHNRETVNLEGTLNHVTKSIGYIISSNNAKINSDFSAINEVEYVPAYMESILLNLITNAIKYKHIDRNPIINIKTTLDYTNNDSIVLEISDNGSGIDMEKFGDKIFGMYKTFHSNSDAVGIGLFITKNQIESLGGTIEIESQLNKGSKFIIKF